MSFDPIHTLIDAFFNWVLNTSLSAIVLIALVFVAQFVFRKVLSARWLYALWLCVLLRLLMPLAPQSSFSIFNLSARFWKYRDQQFSIITSRPELAREAARVPPTPLLLTTAPPLQTPLRLNIHHGIEKRVQLLDAAPYLWLLGALGYLTIVLAQHRKLSLWLKSQTPLSDHRVISVINEAAQLLHLKHRPAAYETNCLPAPSLFGFWKPRLLLPKTLLENLSDTELKLIVLHELIHVKRRDVLLNWLIITLQSLHWFNPFVWLAMSRIRAARELACDAAVLRHLTADDHQVYGGTLIKLVAAFSKAPLTPSLIPIINRKKQMHRRITMIANFKPVPRLITIASAALLAAIACFTFTRAAEKPAAAPKSAAEVPAAAVDIRNQPASQDPQLAVLEKALAEQEEAVRHQQKRLDQLKEQLGIAQTDESPNARSSFDTEVLHKMETIRVEAQADYTQLEALLDQLAKLSRGELKKTILTASPDALLSSLFTQQATAEQKLAELSVKFGAQHPEVLSTKAVLEKIDRQINDRIDGILSGLKTKTESLKAKMGHLQEEVAKVKARDIESAFAQRPYFRAKRELEVMQTILERLQMRLIQEKIDAAALKQ